MTEMQPRQIPSRYIEINGQPLGAGLLRRVFTRWSTWAAISASAAFYAASHDKADVWKTIRTELTLGLGFAYIMRFTTNKAAEEAFTSRSAGEKTVIDTKAGPYTIASRAMQYNAFVATRAVPPVAPLIFYGATAFTMSMMGSFAMFPSAMEFFQSRRHIKKIADGEWSVIPQSAMKLERSPE